MEARARLQASWQMQVHLRGRAEDEERRWRAQRQLAVQLEVQRLRQAVRGASSQTRRGCLLASFHHLLQEAWAIPSATPKGGIRFAN